MERREAVIGSSTVFWTCASAERASVHAVLAEEGLSKVMPELPTPMACLKTVLSDEYPGDKSYRYTVRPAQDGYAVVREPKASDTPRVGDDWGVVVATATLKDEKDIDSLALNPWDYQQHGRITNAMRNKRNWLTSTSVGRIMVGVVEHLDGVAYHKNKGTVYWVPSRNVEKLHRIADGLERAPRRSDDKDETRITCLEVVANTRLMNAVSAGLRAEVQCELDSIMAEIHDGDIGEEACINRLNRVTELSNKASRYEEELGTQLDALRASCGETAKALAVAHLQLSASGREVLAGSC